MSLNAHRFAWISKPRSLLRWRGCGETQVPGHHQPRFHPAPHVCLSGPDRASQQPAVKWGKARREAAKGPAMHAKKNRGKNEDVEKASTSLAVDSSESWGLFDLYRLSDG